MNFPLSKVLAIVIASLLISMRPEKPEVSYIEQYKSMAISEMKRTGIPASIKLAQGLMESQSGRSELAVNANNHFGIKCKSNWEGETYHYKDDDTNENGELVHSCFRKYSSPEGSYLDHSDFLASRSRYKSLFELDKTDYHSWARGLKSCGYATDPNYADKLIETIERFELYSFDQTKEISLEIFPNIKLESPSTPAPIVIEKSTVRIKAVINPESQKVSSKKLSKKRRLSRKQTMS